MTTDLRQQLQTSLGDAYTLERELGGGGMSRTYIAREAALGRRVVVKILSPELAAGVSVDRFKREIQLAATLQHPHVVPVLSTGDAGGLPWFTMPYVEGESLRARLGRGPLRIVEATGILKDVARALEFAHSHGVVHRDIKPDNVLLAGSSATVTDFGIAKALSAARTMAPGGTLTMAGTSIGTPAYMAPEQAAGDPTLDQRSDIYSFGIMAYELLAGRPPFDAATPVKIMTAHFGEKPRDIRELRADTPATLADLIMRCLEKEASARPQSATDLVRVLETVTSSGQAEAAPAILHGQMRPARALAWWALATVAVGLTAWAATSVIGLPDWVFPGSLGVMLAGLPAIGITWYVQRTAQRAYTATPTFTPGGSPSMKGTLATMAIKASPHVSWRRTWIGGAVAVGAFVVLVVGFMVMRALGIGPAATLMTSGKLSANDQIILTDFRSPANDSSLGLTITEALRADLAQSNALRVMPRLTVSDALRLLQRQADSRIDFELARSIASREGIKAVLDGDVVSLGGRYVLSSRLISAQDGQQLAAFKEEASSQNDLIPAIGRLAKQLRSKAGESLKRVHETTALDRVTTSSLEALRKYVAANVLQAQTNDYTRVNPLLQEAVAIDSTFAMAWRRLAQNYNNTRQYEKARDAAVKAYRYAERLSEVERQLTIASYYTLGPEADEEKAFAAYQAALARDSLNFIALTNASNTFNSRGEYDRAREYLLRAISQPDVTNPVPWENAIRTEILLGHWSAADSVQRAYERRLPGSAPALFWGAVMPALRGDFDRGEKALKELQPHIESSRTVSEALLGNLANVTQVRGRLREADRLRTELRMRQAQRAPALSFVLAGLDSANKAAILDDRAQARAILARTIKRVPVDSIPRLDRNYEQLLGAAALAADSTLARKWHAEARLGWEAAGHSVARPAWEAMDDMYAAFAEGRYADALASVDEAKRRNVPRREVAESWRFLILDRLQRSDSAISSGEAFIVIPQSNRLSSDALFLPGVHQRLGEMYEAKGNQAKALEHYQAFVELWKNADPELQPRVRDVRARIDRLRAAMAKKG